MKILLIETNFIGQTCIRKKKRNQRLEGYTLKFLVFAVLSSNLSDMYIERK